LRKAFQTNAIKHVADDNHIISHFHHCLYNSLLHTVNRSTLFVSSFVSQSVSSFSSLRCL